MGLLTLTELQDEVRSSLGGRIDQNARLTRALNIAQQRIVRMHDFDEMEVLQDSTCSYTPDDNDRFITISNLREVYSVIILKDAESLKLTQVPARRWDKVIPKPEYSARNKPRIYRMWASKLEVWPMPDQAYPIRLAYTKWPTALAAPGDVSELIQKDDLLVEAALTYILRSLGKDDDADRHEAIFKRLFKESLTSDSTKPDMEFLDVYSSGGAFGGTPWADPFVKE